MDHEYAPSPWPHSLLAFLTGSQSGMSFSWPTLSDKPCIWRFVCSCPVPATSFPLMTSIRFLAFWYSVQWSNKVTATGDLNVMKRMPLSKDMPTTGHKKGSNDQSPLNTSKENGSFILSKCILTNRGLPGVWVCAHVPVMVECEKLITMANSWWLHCKYTCFNVHHKQLEGHRSVEIGFLWVWLGLFSLGLGTLRPRHHEHRDWET